MLLNFSWIIEGKLAGHSAPHSEKDLTWLKEQGILSLVRMAEHYEKQIAVSMTKFGMWDLHEPVPDFNAPTMPQITSIISFIERSIAANKPVAVSCGAGLGRTGTILACYLVSQGYEAEIAIKEIRKKRPGSIENQEQENAVQEYAATFKSNPSTH